MDDTISEIPSVELNMEQFEDHDADDGGSGDDSGGELHLTADNQVYPGQSGLIGVSAVKNKLSL